MAKAGYSVVTGANVALTAATAKSCLGVKAHANFGLDLKKLRVGFDGVTATDKSVLVELCYCTWASNAPGTNSTSVTPLQIYGRSIAVGFTAARTWTTEPTTLTVLDEWLVTPYGGMVVYDIPLADTYDCALSEGFAVRLTAPTSAVNARLAMQVERC